MPQISILYPEEDRRTVQIPETGLLIGREPSCDLCMADEFVSAKHCRIFSENGTLFLEDLGSTNGTSIDGMEVEEKSVLNIGQSIHIGVTVMKIS